MNAAHDLEPSCGLGCGRHDWCVRETGQRVADGSIARFHHGVPHALRGGDDVVSVALVASEDASTVYVEIEIRTREGHTATAWFTFGEARDLTATLDAITE